MKLACILAIVVCDTALAGPLDPPAGPITSTFKTLQEVEPRTAINAANTPGDDNSIFKITQPGSYYLTGNITGEIGRHGIEIVASGVTIDLNGFDLVGVPGMGAFDGVSVTQSGVTDIAVRNGSVRNWGDEGVDFGSFAASNCSVADIRARGNTGSGIRIGLGSTISGCTADSNTDGGIVASNGCTISSCTAYNNAGDGIYVTGSTISGCTAYGNSGNGVAAFVACTVSACTAYSNAGDGIDAFTGCTISGCTAYNNDGNGIDAGFGATISGCTAYGNDDDGIEVNNDCRVVGNTCENNGPGLPADGAGILAIGSGNRIEGNNCTNNDRGIDVNSPNNIIIKNTCASNATNWDIFANNVFGPIIDRTAPASAAVLGNAAPSSLGSTDPNANFSY